MAIRQSGWGSEWILKDSLLSKIFLEEYNTERIDGLDILTRPKKPVRVVFISGKPFDFYGAPIWLIECRLAFGKEGSLKLPIYLPKVRWKQMFTEHPLEKGEYVYGIGSLRVFQTN